MRKVTPPAKSFVRASYNKLLPFKIFFFSILIWKLIHASYLCVSWHYDQQIIFVNICGVDARARAALSVVI